MKYYIYGLYSSENGIIRYIGKTKNSIFTRLNEHKCDALTKKLKSHKCNWIRKVYKNGYEVNVKLIEEVNEDNWQEREIFWIKKYRVDGNIVNQLDGGESGGMGGKLFQYSYEETKNFITENNLKFCSYSEYKKFLNDNKSFSKRLPLCPKKVFLKRKEWVSWGDFFGNKYVSDKEKNERYFSYDDAKKILKLNNIKTRKEYFSFLKTENRLPLRPWIVYNKKGWVSCYDFFSKKKIKKCHYEVFKRYLAIIFKKPIFMSEYEMAYHSGKYSKKIPAHPDRVYKKKWTEIINDVFYLNK